MHLRPVPTLPPEPWHFELSGRLVTLTVRLMPDGLCRFEVNWVPEPPTRMLPDEIVEFDRQMALALDVMRYEMGLQPQAATD